MKITMADGNIVDVNFVSYKTPCDWAVCPEVNGNMIACEQCPARDVTLRMRLEEAAEWWRKQKVNVEAFKEARK